MIKNVLCCAALLVAFVSVTSGSAQSAPTPGKYTPPSVPLHTEITVEVNKRGQVVRVTSTKLCKVAYFNVQTIGNAEQMWIRRPDGSAQVGLYRVLYDYDPKTQGVTRKIHLISLGGSWGDAPGAATVMIENARKQQEEIQRRAAEQSSKLPSLNEIRGVTPSPRPTPHS